MVNTNQLISIWICPNGKIFKAKELQTHKKLLSNLNLIPDIEKYYKKFNTTDIAYIAQQLGYCRIISYGNQVGIDFNLNFSNECIKSIISIVRNFKINNITLQYINSAKYKQFYNIEDFIDYILSNIGIS